MIGGETQTLTAEERAILGRLADSLIPASADALSASQAGVSGSLFDQAETYIPNLASRLRPVITLLRDCEPTIALMALKSQDAQAYDAFCETIAALYFMSPQVRVAVGFPGREAKPARAEASDLEGLLLPVLEGNFGPREV